MHVNPSLKDTESFKKNKKWNMNEQRDLSYSVKSKTNII